MKRREFVRASIVGATVAGLDTLLPETKALAEAVPEGERQYYELRTYNFTTPQQFSLIDSYYAHAAIPALNRLGIRPVGVFTEMDKEPSAKIVVLIPYDSLETFAMLPAKLAADSEYQKAGADYLMATKTSPAYDRIESTLLLAFEGMKVLEVTDPPSSGKGRVFELRTYQSPGEERGFNKVKMFNSGEITLMKEIGLAPVFYGQALIGEGLPQLTYMTSGENMEEHNKHWKAFSDAPVWKGLKDAPQYKDNVSKIIKTFLKRTAASQI